MYIQLSKLLQHCDALFVNSQPVQVPISYAFTQAGNYYLLRMANGHEAKVYDQMVKLDQTGNAIVGGFIRRNTTEDWGDKCKPQMGFAKFAPITADDFAEPSRD